jgi:mRNA-degrading endonuclease RelE of RelBE toxin-antitoxin system
MPYKISITDDADRQLRSLSARDRTTLEAAIASRLLRDPVTPTKAIKKLRPNPLAQFELRAGDLRALYNVESDEVIVLLVEDDSLVDDLLANNPKFQALVKRSKGGVRKPFVPTAPGPKS